MSRAFAQTFFSSAREHPPQALPSSRFEHLEVRMAASPDEVQQAQALRYRVFYEEMAAVGDPVTLLSRRDVDRFDEICDHLVVLDHWSAERSRYTSHPEIVGTYRLLRQEVASCRQGFYAQAEYDLEPLLRRKPDHRFLELGRSCVLARYRDSRTVALLWRGIWSYARKHKVDVMFGCASLAGTDPDRLALPLSFLHHFAGAAEDWSVRAHGRGRVDMNRLPANAIEPQRGFRALPPLLRGYLRLGAKVGEGAVVDREFGTIDVFVVLPVAAISARYLDRYGQRDA